MFCNLNLLGKNGVTLFVRPAELESMPNDRKCVLCSRVFQTTSSKNRHDRYTCQYRNIPNVINGSSNGDIQMQNEPPHDLNCEAEPSQNFHGELNQPNDSVEGPENDVQTTDTNCSVHSSSDTECTESESELDTQPDDYLPNQTERQSLVLDEHAQLTVNESLCDRLMPHQREGIKFMWDVCFTSVQEAQQDLGSGCILAHCMGLGMITNGLKSNFIEMNNSFINELFLFENKNRENFPSRNIGAHPAD